MAALYAYFRLTDDIADGATDTERKQTALREWRESLRQALQGHYSHPCHAALHQTVTDYQIPVCDLEGVINGAETDLRQNHFETFSELSAYCYDVASTVGRACVRVWGAHNPPVALSLAEPAGIAFQLTNILRDLGEDLERGRVYVPRDEWSQYGCPPESWQRCSESFVNLMHFQIQRAKDYYRRAEPLMTVLSADGRAIYQVIAGIYLRLLEEIEQQPQDVFSKRIRIGPWTKTRLLVTAWPTKWGWL
jgi:phytoene synthase